MAQTEHLPIYKASYALCLHLEQAVGRFGHAHRYGLGATMQARVEDGAGSVAQPAAAGSCTVSDVHRRRVVLVIREASARA